MARASLTVDLAALCANWRSLRDMGTAAPGAVVKADAYGLGMDRVAPALAAQGARHFFVAIAEEGARLRAILGPGPEIFVFSGHMAGDAAPIRDAGLVPLLNDIDQMLRHVEGLPGHPFGIQLDSGMNRLGMEPQEWSALRDVALAQAPRLVMSHLACADEADHAMNARQLRVFREMTDGIEAPRSLANTGGVLLGPAYHFDVTRAGIGTYGGLPYTDARPVVTVEIPVIQTARRGTGRIRGIRQYLDRANPDPRGHDLGRLRGRRAARHGARGVALGRRDALQGAGPHLDGPDRGGRDRLPGPAGGAGTAGPAPVHRYAGRLGGHHPLRNPDRAGRPLRAELPAGMNPLAPLGALGAASLRFLAAWGG